MIEPKVLDSLKLQLATIRGVHKRIRGLNFTNRTTGGKYALSKGYSLYVRRPVQDITAWMSNVEDLLETIIKELEK